MTPLSSSAPLWRQLVAMLYDALLLIALMFVSGFALIALFGPAEQVGETTIPRHLYQGVMMAIIVLFYGVFWTKSGQTLGMQAWRIRLLTAEGEKVHARHVLIRIAAAVLSWLPLGLGYWWSLFDPLGCSWHDRLSATRVVHVPRATGGEATAPPPPANKPQ